MTWSDAALAVWGKTCREDGSWMPLVQHLDDARAVAGLLWDHWLADSVKLTVERVLPAGHRDGRALVTWLASVHDVGKASPAFAVQAHDVQMGWLADRMVERGLAMGTRLAERSRVPHALAGQVALTDWLLLAFDSPPIAATTFADVVGCHHGRAPQRTAVDAARRRLDLLGGGPWHQVREEILVEMTRRSSAEAHLGAWASQPLDVPARMLVLAIVVLADWMASSSDAFPYLTVPVDGSERADGAWDGFALSPPLRLVSGPVEADRVLSARFPALAGRSSRPVQLTSYALARAATSPTLMIIEAPMGRGKTEAALLAAEQLAARDGSGGVFFALPTMATSDAMFARVRSWVETLPDDANVSMFLAHGKAALNDEFAQMARPWVASEIHDESAGVSAASGVADSWLSGRRKGVLSDVVVGTIDQVLYSALNSKFLALRHLALAGKVVVIDEVHAADEHMRMFLNRSLEWLAAYGASVVLLSATLPPAMRDELCAHYLTGLTLEPQPIDVKVGYPAISVVSPDGTSAHAVEEEVSASRVDVACLPDDLEALTLQLQSLLEGGGCVAVIRDTVGRAQTAAAHLWETFGDDVVLVHSRFLANERARREARLREQLGPDSSIRPCRMIVVGTQVLEQSLDVDFDAMISDIAPVDLVLQRVGRLHRHQRPLDARPNQLRAPRLWITGITRWSDDGMPEFDRGVTAVYPESRLLRACAGLGLDPRAGSNLTLPDDIRPLVDRAYDVEPHVPAAWRGRVAKADAIWAAQLADVRRKVAPFVLGEVPWPFESLMELRGLGPDDPEARSGGSVRDGEDGLEVIVVQECAGEVRVMSGDFSHAGALLPTELDAPEPSVARTLALCTVRLPMAMTAPWHVDEVLDDLEAQGFAGWQRSPWLSGHLVLRLDSQLSATVGGFCLRYDRDLGLSTSKAESSDGR